MQRLQFNMAPRILNNQSVGLIMTEVRGHAFPKLNLHKEGTVLSRLSDRSVITVRGEGSTKFL